jgi:beta-xylosidase
VSQLSADGFREVKKQVVLRASDVNTETVEGNRMYKINGLYYILNDQPGSTTYIWKSKSPWGPYEAKILAQNIAPPLNGGNSPHQGSLIKTPNGDWYFMSFTWAYPAGRMPVLAPIKWGSDGFPTFVTGSNGGWGSSYPLPLPAKPLYTWLRSYDFAGTTLGPTWEWNHNPDVNSYTVNNGLTLRTASVTTDIYSARNTLTHRMHGEYPVGTVELEIGNMKDGDRTGLSVFRDRTGYIGVHREGSTMKLATWYDATIDEWSGNPVSPGRAGATANIPQGTTKIWLRIQADNRPTGSRQAKFLYSFDGKSFTGLGDPQELYNGWAFFIAYRFGIFNFATKSLGGSVKVRKFTSA